MEMEIDFDFAQIKFETECDRINNMIDILYENVIVLFQRGNMPISNPDIIPSMTKADFIEWIINNNDYVASFLI